MNENEMIARLQDSFPAFIGDDAVGLSTGVAPLVISKDLFSEGIHFKRHVFTAEDLAIKSLQASISDLAAMGVKPKYVLCGLAVADDSRAYANDYLQALVTVCLASDVDLVGGDIVRSTGKMLMSMTVIGEQKYPMIKRDSAQVGDLIIVIGDLGYVHIGWSSREV